MLNAVVSFLSCLGAAVALLVLFVFVYVRMTPYKEFALIAQDNSAAAIVLAGAVLGFTLPLVAAIYYTHSIAEMALWAVVTCVVQLLVFVVLRNQAKHIEEGNVASAIMVAAFSLAVGMLNAVSISI